MREWESGDIIDHRHSWQGYRSNSIQKRKEKSMRSQEKFWKVPDKPSHLQCIYCNTQHCRYKDTIWLKIWLISAPLPHHFLSSDVESWHIGRWQWQWQGSATHLHRWWLLLSPAQSCSKTRRSLWQTQTDRREEWVDILVKTDWKKWFIRYRCLALHLCYLFCFFKW